MVVSIIIAFCLSLACPNAAIAGTTGTVQGTIVDGGNGSPVANVKVSATSPSQNYSAVSNAQGFYVIQGMIPDTYVLAYQVQGYEPATIAGVTVQQDLTLTENQHLSKSLKEIGAVRSRSAGNLVQPGQTADVYSVSGAQLNAISGGNDLHKTLYQYVQAVPGVTSTGYPAQPRIHGGSITDIAYELDGIPIKDRITGFFTTNLSNVGMGNIEVRTGGLDASESASGLGSINTVVKTGTYPGYTILSYGTSTPGRLQDLTAEYSGATANRKWSWYAALDKTGSLNSYASGLTYPALLVEGANGPGTVFTTDIIGNFHYKPNPNNDFQFLVQNGVGEFNFSYLMNRAPGEPVPLTAIPCPGNHVDPNAGVKGAVVSPTGNVGGTAPNGAACPIGLYFGTANTQNGGGNIWHHYSGLGKIQWNHIINDHSFLALRLAENYNEYVFDQPIVEANIPSIENSPDFQVSATCPLLPYQPNTPIMNSKFPGLGGRVCAQQQNWFNTGYEGNRRSEMYVGSLDYTNAISASTTIKAGISDETDANLNQSYFTFYFNPDGSWPGINSISTYPSHILAAYASLSSRHNKLLLNPGLRYQRMNYNYPGGPYSTGIWNPSFAFAYTMNPDNVLRGSFTDSTSFVGTGAVYRQGSAIFNPGGTFSALPTLIHSADLSFEHQIDSNTSIKFGPWYNNSSNIEYQYKPVTSIDPVTGKATYGPTQIANGGIRRAFGLELGLSHLDHHAVGTSWWLSGTYDNFWTNMTSALTGSYASASLPSIAPLVRNSSNPLISGTLTADLHLNNFSILPFLYYQGPSYYNTGVCYTKTMGNISCGSTSSTLYTPIWLQPERTSSGYFVLNTTLVWHPKAYPNLILGVQGTNLTNNVNDVVPCTANQLGSTPALGPGCGPFWPLGAGSSGLAAGQTGYQNYSQTPMQFQLFLTVKMP
ncbi:MAG: TonB-dependent receptor [Candidatus Eremiobacteraeota bacterium]|nr:TonB-dependent receptor [Candidatus Eremiobacteraeota bacterium]